jgi:hypothetical protein
MAVTTEQQPLDMLGDTIHAQAGLIALLATDSAGNPWACFDEPPDNDDNFPKFIWELPAQASDPGILVEQYDKHQDRLQFSIWTPDTTAIQDIIRAVNVLQGAWYEGAMNTTHWVCTGLHKLTPWAEIEWRSKLIDGQPLLQYTSDWLFKVNRRQNVS